MVYNKLSKTIVYLEAIQNRHVQINEYKVKLDLPVLFTGILSYDL